MPPPGSAAASTLSALPLTAGREFAAGSSTSSKTAAAGVEAVDVDFAVVGTRGGSGSASSSSSSSAASISFRASPVAVVVTPPASPATLPAVSARAAVVVEPGFHTVKGPFHANEDRLGVVLDLREAGAPPGLLDRPITLALMCDGHDGSTCADFLTRGGFLAALFGALRGAAAGGAAGGAGGGGMVAAVAAAAAAAAAVGGVGGKAPVGSPLPASPDWKAIMVATFAAAEAGWIAHVASRRAGRRGGTGAAALSGACVTAMLLDGTTLVAANVGDCRAVLVPLAEAGAGGSLAAGRAAAAGAVVLTTDHRAAAPAERARMVRLAGPNVVRAGRVLGVLEPSRTIGDLGEKARTRPGVISVEPDVTVTTLPTGGGGSADAAPTAAIVLATDGVWDTLATSCVATVVGGMCAAAAAPTATAANIASAARAGGSQDDISCIVMTVRPALGV